MHFEQNCKLSAQNCDQLRWTHRPQLDRCLCCEFLCPCSLDAWTQRRLCEQAQAKMQMLVQDNFNRRRKRRNARKRTPTFVSVYSHAFDTAFFGCCTFEYTANVFGRSPHYFIRKMKTNGEEWHQIDECAQICAKTVGANVVCKHTKLFSGV